MLERPFLTGLGFADGFIAALQRVPSPVTANASAARFYLVEKPPSRDFGIDIDIPTVDPITRTLLYAIF